MKITVQPEEDALTHTESNKSSWFYWG